MRPIIQELFNKFAGTDVYIVGGGNSLKNFDFNLLEKRNVIALNAAYHYVGENAVLYWGDQTWGRDNEEGLAAHPSKYKLTSRINCDGAIKDNKLGAAGSHFLKKTGNNGYDSDVNNVRGNNSGGQAINFAVNLCARRIILLGFDMGYTFGKTHFHNKHTEVTAANVYADLFIPSIQTLANEIKHLPVEIINCSPTTALKCFKIADIKDYL